MKTDVLKTLTKMQKQRTVNSPVKVEKSLLKKESTEILKQFDQEYKAMKKSAIRSNKQNL